MKPHLFIFHSTGSTFNASSLTILAVIFGILWAWAHRELLKGVEEVNRRLKFQNVDFNYAFFNSVITRRFLDSKTSASSLSFFCVFQL